mgnify:FL=1
MGVRPPADDGEEQNAIEFGIAALDATLSDADIEYPVDASTLQTKIGHRSIPFDVTGN